MVVWCTQWPSCSWCSLYALHCMQDIIYMPLPWMLLVYLFFYQYLQLQNGTNGSNVWINRHHKLAETKRNASYPVPKTTNNNSPTNVRWKQDHKLEFCLQMAFCRQNPCFCCLTRSKCYDTRDECKANCPPCDPNCRSPVTSEVRHGYESMNATLHNKRLQIWPFLCTKIVWLQNKHEYYSHPLACCEPLSDGRNSVFSNRKPLRLNFL